MFAIMHSSRLAVYHRVAVTKKKNHDLQEYCVKLYHQITCMLFYFCSIKDMALGLLT